LEPAQLELQFGFNERNGLCTFKDERVRGEPLNIRRTNAVISFAGTLNKLTFCAWTFCFEDGGWNREIGNVSDSSVAVQFSVGYRFSNNPITRQFLRGIVIASQL
jgi:hypothetical protein